MECGLAFGSVGDIISICRIVIELRRALRDTAGSAQQYQELRKDLDDYLRILMQVCVLSLSV